MGCAAAYDGDCGGNNQGCKAESDLTNLSVGSDINLLCPNQGEFIANAVLRDDTDAKDVVMWIPSASTACVHHHAALVIVNLCGLGKFVVACVHS